MNSDSERALVERAQANPDAFGELYDLHYDRIFRYILRRTADLTLAQDITSETFLSALRGLKTFQWRGVPFASWLYRIASNEIATHHRKSRQTIRSSAEDDVSLATRSAEDEIRKAQDELNQEGVFLEIHQALEQLPLKYREVIVLRFFEGKRILEIGEILEKRPGTVKSLIHRGLKRLRALIEDCNHIDRPEL